MQNTPKSHFKQKRYFKISIFFYAAIGYKVANESKLKRHHYFICILFIKGSHLWIMVISCVALEYTNRQES